ncbi:hypothetical protein F9C07_11720 [Aspergillus flavus]|uniref:Uncharacterized protein n=1 Tax=Aspergillus flavus (strain ATCC 200026 / FGSC A1120 / IAM 13836 / NRRL 3357 / JCM 12722 / SRRC 167) TaxID=332952 RepID=A0A7U2N3U7_ASPFN|nr:hypothetical protein F9C07_11720 [Aspergillus flavus]
MHSVTGRKGGGIIWEGKVKKETQQVACMICRYSASLTGGPRLEARNINLPESASSLPMVSAAKINTGSLFENAVRMTGGKCLNLFIDPYKMCNQRLLVDYWPGLNVLMFVVDGFG